MAECWAWCWRFLLLMSARRRICFSSRRTHVGNVFVQKLTYCCPTIGFAAPAAPAAAAGTAAPEDTEADPEVAAGELAAWASWPAALTIDEAALKALERFGLEPEGARTEAIGELPAAAIRLEAKEPAEELAGPPAGLVCM